MEQLVIGLTKQALLITLLLSAPAMLSALLVGFIISLFQAVTQVQEQTLTFVPKILATFIAIGVAGTWMLATLIRFATAVFTMIAEIR
ncbi:MAG: flagellar biosynthesis protein FliQ [Acidobacteriota bacterium]|nr:flagellar biosynthesis protein FliQ [Blastocatellia bacterium]MDW8411875.1 flagellar biosynthesis protein FliQ [Acidobacteriota bacterium]